MTTPEGSESAAVGTPRWEVLLVGVLACLVMASLHLAISRMLQVDEAQQVFQAGILARNQSSLYYTHAPLLHLGPMAWIARHAGGAESVFLWNRILFLAVFWINILLLARLCAGSWRSSAFLGWLVAAATLAPLWDYGFEIRHDNVMLTGLLVLWGLGRAWRLRPWLTFAAMGAVSVVLQFCAFKAFMYWIPLCVVFVLFPPFPPGKGGRLGAAMALIAGGILAFLAVRGAFTLAGGWEAHVAGFKGGLTSPAKVERFTPFPALGRLVFQTPLLLALSLTALVECWRRWRQAGRNAIAWDGLAPEAGLLLLVMVAFLVNPTPFPYNLVFLVPFLLLSAAALWRVQGPFPRGPLLAGLLVFGHALPFLLKTARHWDYPMDRQVQLMKVAEVLTDPATDRVYDGVGLVPSRASIGYDWWLHTFTIQSFYDGTRPAVRTMLEANPAAVIITSYRTDWLPKEDQLFIRAHYLPLADDFHVLGGLLPEGGGPWQCLKPGRYEVRARTQQQMTVRVDGRDLPSPAVVTLDRGSHELGAVGLAQVVWLGPRISTLPPLTPGNHKNLFINWY